MYNTEEKTWLEHEFHNSMFNLLEVLKELNKEEPKSLSCSDIDKIHHIVETLIMIDDYKQTKEMKASRQM